MADFQSISNNAYTNAMNNRDVSQNVERVKKEVEAMMVGSAEPAVVQPVAQPVAQNKMEQKSEKTSFGEEQLVRAIQHALKSMEGKSTHLQFSVHEKTKQIMVKVLDNESGKVVREIPSEKTFDFLAKVWEMTGLLIDEKR